MGKSQYIRLFAWIIVGPVGILSSILATDLSNDLRFYFFLLSFGTIFYNFLNWKSILYTGKSVLGYGQSLRLVDLFILAPMKYMISQSKTLPYPLKVFQFLGAFGTIIVNGSMFIKHI